MRDLAVFVIIVSVAAVITESIVCPGMCKCRSSQHDTTSISSLLECNYTKDIGKLLPINTQNLIVEYLTAQQFQELFQSLQKSSLPKLNYINITYSDLPDYLSLTNLTISLELELSHNRIKNGNLTLNVTRIKSLNLSHNKIKQFKFHSIKTTLETLNLSANSLSVVNFNKLPGFKLLKHLDLSSNNLTLIGDDYFSELYWLLYLNLSRNRIKLLSGKCFRKLLKLQQLDVSWNNLKQVSLAIQLPSLMRLDLEGNQELGHNSREPTLLIGAGTKLKIVDVSRTGLEQVPTALTQSIRTLQLQGNVIRTIECGDLDSYPLLQLLDLASNNLQYIEYDALGRMETLSILYINNNILTDVPKSLPEKLKVLHLHNNQINKINSADLQGLRNLEVLLISDNQIETIEAGAFNHVISLVTLDLSRNPIKLLSVGCFSGPEALQVLRLSSITIDLINVLLFPLSAPEHLITLDLSGSPQLVSKFLDDTATLAASKQLQELDLSFANIATIRYDLLFYLSQLRILYIKGNKLNCTDLEWLATWMRKQGELDYQELTCSSPIELWGTFLLDLPEKEAITTKVNQINETITNLYDNEVDVSEFQQTQNLSSANNNSFYVFKSNVTNNLETSTYSSFGDEQKYNKNDQLTEEKFVMKKLLGDSKMNITEEGDKIRNNLALIDCEENKSVVPTALMFTLVYYVMLFFAVLFVITAFFLMVTTKMRRYVTPKEEVSEVDNVTELW